MSSRPHRAGWSSTPLSRRRRACVPRAPGTGRVTWAQSPRHTGTQTEPLLRGSLAQATWRQSWGLNQRCPPGDDTQPGLGNGRTAGPGRGAACSRGLVRPRDLDGPPHLPPPQLTLTHTCTCGHSFRPTCARTHACTRAHRCAVALAHARVHAYRRAHAHTLTRCLSPGS